MTTSALSLFALLVGQAPATKPFVSAEHALQWNSPVAWTMTKSKGSTKFTIPTSAGPATLEIYATFYRREAAEWQALQVTIADQGKRTVDRQWEEQLLGVPFLMTQTSTANDVRLIGLLYSAQRNKFHFRLDASTAAFPEANQMWRETLQTLRSTSDSLPAVENPDKPLPTPPKVDTTAPIRLGQNSGGKNLPKGSVDITVSNRTVSFRYPKSVELIKPGPVMTFTHPKLAGEVKLEFFHTIDSPVAGTAILSKTNKELDRFSKVSTRVNEGPKNSPTGCDVFKVVRQGESESGPLQMISAVGAREEFYWMISFESTDSAKFAQNRKILFELADQFSFAVAKQ